MEKGNYKIYDDFYVLILIYCTADSSINVSETLINQILNITSLTSVVLFLIKSSKLSNRKNVLNSWFENMSKVWCIYVVIFALLFIPPGYMETYFLFFKYFEIRLSISIVLNKKKSWD